MVGRTREHPEHSGRIVRESVNAMDQIAASSRSISHIIGVIAEVAFYANPLALNAVVAQETRKLAQPSAKAPRKIKTLITAEGGHVRRPMERLGNTAVASRKRLWRRSNC